jgi:hypothetical protein
MIHSGLCNYINVHSVFFSRKMFAREVGNISQAFRAERSGAKHQAVEARVSNQI